jgi:hypothetical protein
LADGIIIMHHDKIFFYMGWIRLISSCLIPHPGREISDKNVVGGYQCYTKFMKGATNMYGYMLDARMFTPFS